MESPGLAGGEALIVGFNSFKPSLLGFGDGKHSLKAAKFIAFLLGDNTSIHGRKSLSHEKFQHQRDRAPYHAAHAAAARRAALAHCAGGLAGRW